MVPLALALIGCEAPSSPDAPDAPQALVELAEANAARVHPAIRAAIEADGIDLDALDSGAALADEAVVTVAEGEVTVDWALSYWESDAIEGERHWDWAYQIRSARLELPSALVEATGDWTVETTSYDVTIDRHAFAGTLSLDGGDPVDASYEAVFSGNLHRVDGAVAGEDVTWENPDPDLP